MSKYILGGFVFLGIITSMVYWSDKKDNILMNRWDNCEESYQHNIALPFNEQMRDCMDK